MNLRALSMTEAVVAEVGTAKTNRRRRPVLRSTTHEHQCERRGDDVSVNHAWIEEIDFVYEFSEGRKILFSKDDYYKKNKIINVRTYTAQEAITLIGEYGHWGPWN